MEEEKMLIHIPAERNYIEILGYKIDGYSSFESFCKELNELKDIKKQYKELKEIEQIHRQENGELRKQVKELEENLTSVYLKGVYDEREKWIALVKEKIEELNEYYKKEIYPSLINWSELDITEYYDGMLEILEELLEKRK